MKTLSSTGIATAITMPLIGNVIVGGLTTVEAQRLVEGRLRADGFLRDPQVSVFAKEYASQGISIMGEVQHPGIYPLLGGRRLYDAISAAGGTTPRAGRAVTITHRDDPAHPIIVEVNTDPSRSPASNVEVSPGDTIIVSRAGLVYVVGEVGRPAGFVMENHERMTVLQAVAMAGGTTRVAALKQVRIIRRTPKGIEEVPIPLNQILAAKTEDIPLLPEDVLFVPSSKIKSAGRRSAEAALAIATGVAIYGR
jgi:polysaccharide export outer membrane protein